MLTPRFIRAADRPYIRAGDPWGKSAIWGSPDPAASVDWTIGLLRQKPDAPLPLPAMNSQREIDPSAPLPADASRFAEPGVPRIRAINWAGMRALYLKEVRRFMKVQLQTIWAPSLTTLLFLVIFTVALGGERRMVLGVPFADFIAPGLIMMGMIQNSFANSSFALLVGKIQGTLVDYLMPPISTAEMLAAMVGAAVTRAWLVGFAIWLAMLAWPGVHVAPSHLWAIAAFGMLGAGFVAFLGVLTSIWAEKFDRTAVAAFRHLLCCGQSLSAVSRDQPRQPVFLCDFWFPLRVFIGGRQQYRCGPGCAGHAEPRAGRFVLRAVTHGLETQAVIGMPGASYQWR
jgi:hypothetical protein